MAVKSKFRLKQPPKIVTISLVWILPALILISFYKLGIEETFVNNTVVNFLDGKSVLAAVLLTVPMSVFFFLLAGYLWLSSKLENPIYFKIAAWPVLVFGIALTYVSASPFALSSEARIPALSPSLAETADKFYRLPYGLIEDIMPLYFVNLIAFILFTTVLIVFTPISNLPMLGESRGDELIRVTRSYANLLAAILLVTAVYFLVALIVVI